MVDLPLSQSVNHIAHHAVGKRTSLEYGAVFSYLDLQ